MGGTAAQEPQLAREIDLDGGGGEMSWEHVVSD